MAQYKSADSTDWNRGILPAPTEINEVVHTFQNCNLRQPEKRWREPSVSICSVHALNFICMCESKTIASFF